MSKLPRDIYAWLCLALFLGLFFNSYNKDECLFTIVAILGAWSLSNRAREISVLIIERKKIYNITQNLCDPVNFLNSVFNRNRDPSFQVTSTGQSRTFLLCSHERPGLIRVVFRTLFNFFSESREIL